METIKVALLGLGTVGSGVYETINTHQRYLQDVLGRRVEVVAILIKDQEKIRSVKVKPSILLTTDIEDIFKNNRPDIVIEVMGGIEPAKSYIIQSLAKGCHIITANKELMAYYGKELKDIAHHHGVSIAYEASVAGGIPIIRTLHQVLQVNQILKIEGIINGTSNYILSQMRTKQITFEQALKEAQAAGFAEADPKHDIEGYDSFFKLMVLSEIILNEKPDWSLVERKGINEVSSGDLLLAEGLGLRLKLIASLLKNELGWTAKVAPALIDDKHPLYSVEGVDNALVIETDVVGRLFLQGPGAGSLPTASAIIEDLVDVWQHRNINFLPKKKRIANNKISKPRDEFSYWLLTYHHDKDFTEIDRISWINLLTRNNLVLDESLTLNSDQNNFVTGFVVAGNNKNIKQMITEANNEKLNFYPIYGRKEKGIELRIARGV